MIGQTKLLSKLDRIIDRYPKFSIIVAPVGSGKKELCKIICNKLDLSIIYVGSKIDEVRSTIDLAYSQDKPLCYIFSKADEMSIGAKNCLLKITEEPPKNAYFILCLTSLENTLETLKSRATVLNFDNYTKDEIIDYRKYRRYNSENDDLVLKICSNTGEVDELFKNNIADFYNYVISIFKYIPLVNSGNLFKITNNLKLKEDVSGYSPLLVFKLLIELYIDEALKQQDTRYLCAAKVTINCLKDLRLPTVSKQATIDNWIFEVRKVLR